MEAAAVGAAPTTRKSVHECSICYHAYSTDATHNKAPKVLLCGHTFCADCITKGVMAASGKPVCAVCKRESSFPGEQVAVNYTLIESMKRAEADDVVGKEVAPSFVGACGFFCGCAPSVDGGAADEPKEDKCVECEQKAVVHCETCNMDFCGDCFSLAHPAKLKSMAAHKSTPVASRRAVPMCTTHNKPLELFCHQEHALVCHSCVFAEPHKAHQESIRLLTDVAAQVRAAVDVTRADLDNHATDLARVQQEVNRTFEQVNTGADVCTRRVQTRFDELVRLMREQQQALVVAIAKDRAEKQVLLKTQDQQLKDARALVEEARAGLAAMKVLADGDMLMGTGKTAINRTQVVMELALACKREVCVADAQIPLSLLMDGEIERAIRGYGALGGPGAPLWEGVKEEERGDRDVKVGWGAVEGAEVYEVEVREMDGGGGVGGGEGGTAPARGGGGGGGCNGEEGGMEYREWQQVHRGAGQTVVVKGLVGGHGYGMRVRGVGAGGLGGRWSEVMVVRTRERPRNMYDGIGENVRWPGDALRLAGDDDDEELPNGKPRYFRVNVKGRVGMEVRAGTGAVGYVEARVVRKPLGHSVHLAFVMEKAVAGPHEVWGHNVPGSCCWWDGFLQVCDMPGLEHGWNGKYRFDGFGIAPLKFKVRQIIGLMVDCRGRPCLRFFVDGVQVHVVEIGVEAEGGIWYPGGGVANGEMVFVDRPRMPKV